MRRCPSDSNVVRIRGAMGALPSTATGHRHPAPRCEIMQAHMLVVVFANVVDNIFKDVYNETGVKCL